MKNRKKEKVIGKMVANRKTTPIGKTAASRKAAVIGKTMEVGESCAPVSAVYVGVDVGSATLSVAVRDGDGNTLQKAMVVANARRGWHVLARRLPAGALVLMEPTSHYHLRACEYFTGAGFAVHLLGGKAVKDYAASMGLRNKTDGGDAELIAAFGATRHRLGKLRAWVADTAEEGALRERVKLLEAAKSDCRAASNRLLSLRDRGTIRRQKAAVRFHQKQILELDKEIAALCESSEVFRAHAKNLQTIPGIAAWAAAVLLAEKIHRADDVRALAAMHALAPARRQSGKCLNNSRLSSQGRRLVRRALYFPTLSAIRHNPTVRAFHQRLSKRGIGGKKLICACAHKLLRIAFGVVKNQQPFNQNAS